MIRELRIRRFKQFEDVALPLEGHVVLAGQNNSGKTTVLQALSAWRLAYEQWLSLNDRNKHNGAYSRKPVTRQSFSAVPLRSFDLLWRDRRYNGTVEIDLVTTEGWRMAMELTADSTEQIYVRPHRDTPREVLDQAAPTMVYVSSVDGLEIEEAAINNPDWVRTLLGRQRPGSILRNLLLEVSSGAHWDRLRESIRKLFGIELLVPRTEGGVILCEYQRPGQTHALDILSAGSGLHQILLLLAVLYTRGGSVLLIDEPDAHLHVFLQDTVFAELRRVAAATQSQIILATHSEVIFRSVPPEQLVLMMGAPRRVADVTERRQLAQAMAILDQSDVVAALDAPGVLYLEGHTDLDLLRAWAEVLEHPLAAYLNRQPFWRPQVYELRDGADGIKAQDHFNALRLARPDISAVLLQDSDGRDRGEPGAAPRQGALNRLRWERYESESYLVHPQALTRFIESLIQAPARDVVMRFFSERLGGELAQALWDAPFTSPPLVETYLRSTKARTDIIGALLQTCGIHGFEYTRYDEIARTFTQGEVHPEVRVKLDFIQQAFGL